MNSTYWSNEFLTNYIRGINSLTPIGGVWKRGLTALYREMHTSFIMVGEEILYSPMGGGNIMDSMYHNFNEYTLYYKNESKISVGVMPDILGYSLGNRSKSEVVDGRTYVSNRIVSDVCFNNNVLYLLHIDVIRHTSVF